MNKTGVAKFWEEVHNIYQLTPNWRFGQTVFNHLWTVRPDLSEQIRGTRLDPFYVRETYGIIKELDEWLRENW